MQKMIVFSLDGTLADCEHRRHFVDPTKDPNAMQDIYSSYADGRFWDLKAYEESHTAQEWKPDWKAFYEACDQDKPIEAVISIWNDQISLGAMGKHQIWSGRCASVREKTEKWLHEHLLCFESHQLKMRLIGDNTPDDQLKERWWREYYDSLYPKLDKDSIEGTEYHRKEKIEFVFTSNPKEIAMWRKYGIFVFNCAQHDGEV